MAQLETKAAESRRRKKLALFVSSANPAFDVARSIEREIGLLFANLCALTHERDKEKVREHLTKRFTDKASDRHEILGISHETLRRWSRLDVAGAARDREILARFNHWLSALTELLEGAQAPITEIATWLGGVPMDARRASAEKARSLNEMVGRFRADYDDAQQAVRVYETGKTLGIPLTDVQLAVDTAIYAERPLLHHAYFDKGDAEPQFAAVGGIYRAWVRRHHGEMRTWMRCSLHIRYVLEVAGRHSIRVKLNLPTLFSLPTAEGPQPSRLTYWEYDGFLDIREQNVFWIFEKRDDFRIDYFTAVTSRRKTHKTSHGPMAGFFGRYLTAHQDSEQSVVSGPIIVELVARAPGAHSLTPDLPPYDVYTEVQLKDFMWKEPLRLGPADAECARLDALVTELRLDQ